MGVRGKADAGLSPRLGGLLAFVLLLGWLTIWPAAEARQVRRALAHHATILNGDVVGSAFQIADGLAVTNAHVVRGRRPGHRLTLETADGRGRVTGRLVAISDRIDLALVAVPRDFLPTPGMVGEIMVGQPVIAAGVDASGHRPGLPRMELSGHVTDADERIVQFGPGFVARVPGVRPGFSGGPLFDARGRLLGMIAAIRPGEHGVPAAAASGFAPAPDPQRGEEAYVLHAPVIFSEARRLLAEAR